MNKRILSPVRQPLVQGRRDIAGLWLPHEWYSEIERQRIVWQFWQKGAKLLRFTNNTDYPDIAGDLLHFLDAKTMFCADLPGWPLVAYGKTLSAADLNNDEKKKLPAADCWIISGDEVKALKCNQGVAIDPSQWINLAGYKWLDSFDLTPPPSEIEEIIPVASGDARSILGKNIAAPDEKQQKALKALKEKAASTKTHTSGEQGDNTLTEIGWGIRLIKWLFCLGLFIWIGQFIYFRYIARWSSPELLRPSNIANHDLVQNSSSSGSGILSWMIFLGLFALALYLLRKFMLSETFRKMTASSVDEYEAYQERRSARQARQQNIYQNDDTSGARPYRHDDEGEAVNTATDDMAGRNGQLANYDDDEKTTSANGQNIAGSSFEVGGFDEGEVNQSIKSNTGNSGGINSASGGKKNNSGSDGQGGLKQRDEDEDFAPPLWRRLLARIAMTSHISQLLGMRQARYLTSLMRMFEEGDLDKALRHALPFSPYGSEGERQFGVPRPRDNLSLSGVRSGGISSSLGEEVTDILVSYYRRAFNKLDQQGRIEEAAFVLAELLDERADALDYLEKNGRIEQAAELALSWDMASDIILRLYCLAGKWEWAIAIARRDRCFVGAIMRLEQDGSPVAARLREEWALFEAENGNLMSAIQIIWPLKDKRDLALKWLEQAENSGGELSAAALVKRAILLPDTVESYRDTITKIIDHENPKLFERLISEIVINLSSEENSDGLIFLTRFITRPALLHYYNGALNLDKDRFLHLLKASGQSAFEIDLPKQSWVESNLDIFSEDNFCYFEEPAMGRPLDIHDIVRVSEGRFIIALGDGGVVLLDGLGRQQAFFDVPASKLVVSGPGTIVLLVMQRDELSRITRLNLADNSLTPLGSLPIQTMARDFDGVSWSVALSDGFVYVLDTARGLKSFWKSGKLDGAVYHIRYRLHLYGDIATNARGEQWLIQVPDQWKGTMQLESWYYSLPNRILHSRHIIPELAGENERIFLPEDYIAYRYGIEEDDDGAAELYYSDILNSPDEIHSISLDDDYDEKNMEASMFGFDEGYIASYDECIYAISKNDEIIATLAWGDTRYRLAEQQNHLIVYDDRGRFFHFDMANNIGKAITVQ